MEGEGGEAGHRLRLDKGIWLRRVFDFFFNFYCFSNAQTWGGKYHSN